jgi:hypothetical protein
MGTEKSKGTKIFSLVGKVANTGLVEVPMGTTLRTIVEDIGGGVPENKRFKAVQTGGPSGGCIPKELIDLPVDYERLTEAGSIMGSGGMIVMDETTCMVDLARYFMEFLVEESCGQCVPCREGLKRMLQVLTKICDGNGTEKDLELLEELSATLRDFSLCGLGKTAPNPVMSTLRYLNMSPMSGTGNAQPWSAPVLSLLHVRWHARQGLTCPAMWPSLVTADTVMRWNSSAKTTPFHGCAGWCACILAKRPAGGVRWTSPSRSRT